MVRLLHWSCWASLMDGTLLAAYYEVPTFIVDGMAVFQTLRWRVEGLLESVNGVEQ